MSDASKRSKRYRDPQVRKQVSVFLPALEWRELRDEAARRRVPVAELCRGWMRTGLERLRGAPPGSREDPRRRAEAERRGFGRNEHG